MIFGLWKRSETDSTKIAYTASAAGVCVARVAYEDIRQAFGLPGVSNELLRARAHARVTNKKALSEIATSLLEAGQAKRIYDYLVVDISRSGWSEKDFPDMSLLIAASIPQLGGTGSTFLYKPSRSVDEMNAQLSPILERTKYSAAYLYLVMWRSVYKWTREGG